MFKKLKDNETLQYILVKGGITLGLRMLSLVLSFGSMWFMARFLGKDFYGLYSLALTIMQIAALVVGLGMPAAFISFTGAYESEEHCKGLLVKCIRVALIAVVLPVGLFLFCSGSIATGIFLKPNLYPYLQAIAIGLPAMIVHELICYYFLSVKKIVTYGIFIFILPNLIFCIGLLLLYVTDLPGFYAFPCFAGAYVVTVISGLIIIFGKKGIKHIQYPAVALRELLKRSLLMMLGGIFLTLLNWTDILILGRYVSEGEIGIYNSAFRIGSLSLFFVASMNVVIAPKVSELFYQGNFTEMKKVVNRATQLVILLTAPFCLGLIFFGDFVMEIFGDDFEAGATTLTLITMGGLFNAMTGNVDQILNMTNNQKWVGIIFFAGFVLNVLLNLFLIPLYGKEGAAGASLICSILVNGIFVIVIRKKLGFYTFV